MQAPVPAEFADYLHVVAAAILDGAGNVFIALRPDHLHQGGMWEFPGGKVESGETVISALNRELNEEIGIAATHASPLIRIPYSYPDRNVLLDVWRVTGYTGNPHGREGQETRWVSLSELTRYRFPAANRPIITALSLPDRYLITPEPTERSDWPLFLEQLEKSLACGIRLVQLRAKGIAPDALLMLAQQALSLCRRYEAKMLLNAPVEMALRAGADGVHLNSRELYRHGSRPLSDRLLIGVSCHTAADFMQAMVMEADFTVLSPVLPTTSHADAQPLGWEAFGRLAGICRLPVYALGGMATKDAATAIAHGGQGIAAIRALWGEFC